MWLSDAPNRLYGSTDWERRFSHPKRSAREPRDEFERDYGRIVHSAAFRRMQSKTQVIGTGVSDFPRTRLTHSMEVAQIARGIAIALNQHSPLLQPDRKIDTSLIEAAALAHDLGHPPFGHQGERALDACMREHGGFESNAHTFRLLTRLEGKPPEGLNVTRALLLSILKYPIVYDDACNPQATSYPPKAGLFAEDREAFEWVLRPFNDDDLAYFLQTERSDKDRHVRTVNRTLECSIIEIADDIAYATHDLEDALNLRMVDVEPIHQLIERDQLHEVYPGLKKAVDVLRDLRPRDDDFKSKLKHMFAYLIDAFVRNVQLRQVQDVTSDRLRWTADLPDELRRLCADLKTLVKEEVIESDTVQTVEWKGQYIVRKLFEAFLQEPKLLPKKDRQLAEEGNKERVVCDHIAGMTDSYAWKTYAKLYGISQRFFD
jgi:dGTPase